MKLWSGLRKLNRRTLVCLLAALVIAEAGLVALAMGAPRSRHGAAPVVGTAAPAAQPSPSVMAHSAAAPVASEPAAWQPPASWTAPPQGPSAAAGDLTAVARGLDVEEALAHVQALAAPEMGGRQAGSPGGAAASQYIADRFAEAGLLPAGPDGYFQPFQVPYARMTSTPTLRMIAASGEARSTFVFRQDFAVVWGGYAGGGEADGPVTWAGDCLARDFDGLDVTGGVVLCRGSHYTEALRQAAEHRATGLLLLAEDPSQITRLRSYREPPLLAESIPALWVGDAVTEWLLRGSGYRPSDLTILHTSQPLGTRAAFRIEMDEPGEAVARNVLGVLPGTDPEHSGELLILGAHYDHLGSDGNGDLYAGANDDASGVAALLEIARSWQAAGYVPDVSVLFAAWDAEEQALLGAAWYVAHPLVPLDKTIGMIQLDMIGLASDGVLTVDGLGNPVGDQLAASAGLLGVPVDVAAAAGSDHREFAQAGVDAALMIWDNARVPWYHTPADTLDTLQPERLQQAGVIASHAALALSSAQGQVRAVVAAQAAAISAGDGKAYVATLDPQDPTNPGAGAAWLADRIEATAGGYTASVESVVVGEGWAIAELTARRTVSDGTTELVAEYPLRLVRRPEGWYASGPASETVETPLYAVRFARPWRAQTVVWDELAAGQAGAPPQPTSDEEWAAALNGASARIQATLGVTPTAPTAVTVYPNDLARLWLAPGAAWTNPTSLPATEVSRTAPVTETALSLVLEGMGLPAGQGVWLRDGLLAWLSEDLAFPVGSDGLSAGVAGLPASLDPLAVLGATGPLSAEDRALARSLVGTLLAERGTDGLRTLLSEWGAAGSLDGALAPGGTDALARDWQQVVAEPLDAARAGIASTLERRTAAFASGDATAFLSTVAEADVLYRAEQSAWFDQAAALLSSWSEDGEVVALPGSEVALPGSEVALQGDEALVRLTAVGATSGGDLVRYGGRARFVREGEAWLLAGPVFTAYAAGTLMVQIPPDLPEPSREALLAAVSSAEVQVAADLGVPLPRPLAVRMAASAEEYACAVAACGEVAEPAHYAPGQAIVLSGALAASDYAPWLARLLARAALSSAGVPEGPLREGLALLEAARAAPDAAWTLQATYVPAVREAQRFGRLADLTAPPALPVPEEHIAVNGQGWLLWDALAREFGMGPVRSVVRRLAQGQALDVAFTGATGRSFSEWHGAWLDSIATAGVPAQALAAAEAFDASRALATVRELASVRYAGRQTGSLGAAEAGLWIADQMATTGLVPAGTDGTFFRTQPVTLTTLLSAPSLSFWPSDTGEELVLPFPDGFREVLAGVAGAGEANAGLVWIPGEIEDGMQLGGRIALKPQVAEPAVEAEVAARAGAGGLVLVSTRVDTRTREVPVSDAAEGTLPVVQITEETWRSILGLAGLTTRDALDAPPALLLPVTAHIAVPFGPAEPAQASDVVGLLPGTRPDAAPLVVMAHYDGVGSLPGGPHYPGANKDASGVAVLLEAARRLVAGGQPLERSIYFVAAGAEEMGGASTRALFGDPFSPLAEPLGVLILDQVGQARSYYLTWDGDAGREGRLLAALELAAELVDRRASPGQYHGVNSHQPLQETGIPAVLLFWPNADNVHQPEDTPDALDLTRLAATGEVLTLALSILGR